MKITDPVFNTDKEQLQGIWNALQILQVDFALRQELSLFYQSTSWIRSKHALDAGCGNGYYLGELVKYFPGKKITGVDFSDDLINSANTKINTEDINFIKSDFFDVDGLYDAVIMRLFLQHLQNPIEAIEKAYNMISKNGCVLIVDSIDAYRHYYPDIPKFKALFDLYCHQQVVEERDRDIARSLVEYVHRSNNWKIEVNQEIVIPSTLHENQELFLKIYTEFVNMVEAVGEINYSFDDVRSELSTWSSNDGYTQIGLKLLSLVKT